MVTIQKLTQEQVNDMSKIVEKDFEKVKERFNLLKKQNSLKNIKK